MPAGVELSENTLQITDIQTEALTSVDSDNATLCFNSSLVESQIPKVGQIMLQFSPTDKLPFGFLGKVSEVKNDGQTIIVSTTAVDLDEAFEKLNLSVDIEMEPVEPENEVKSTIKGETSISMGGSMRISTAVDNSMKQNDITVDCSFLIGLEYLIKAHIEKEGEFSYQIGKPIKIHTPSGFTVQSSIQFNLVTAYSGCIDMQYSGACSCVYPFVLGRRNGVLYTSFNNLTLAGQENELTKEPEISTELMLSLNLQGSLYFEIIPEISFKLFGRDEMKLSAMPSIGYEYSGEIGVEINDNTGTEEESKTLYQMFKDEHLTSALQCGVNFGINFFELRGETHFDRYTLKEDEKYLFPTFGAPEQTKEGSYTKLTTMVDRGLLFPMEISLGLYENTTLCTGLETPVTKSNTYKYSLEEKFANPLTASFTVPQDHTVYPCITVGTKTIRADWEYDIVGKWRLIDLYGVSNIGNSYIVFTTDGTGVYAEDYQGEYYYTNFTYTFDGVNLTRKEISYDFGTPDESYFYYTVQFIDNDKVIMTSNYDGFYHQEIYVRVQETQNL